MFTTIFIIRIKHRSNEPRPYNVRTRTKSLNCCIRQCQIILCWKVPAVKAYLVLYTAVTLNEICDY